MNRRFASGALLAFFAVLIMAGCSSQTPPVKPTPTAAPVGKGGTVGGDSIIADGQVVPVKSAALSFATGGIVTQLPVALGQHVQDGALIAQLDTRQLELQVAQADANLAAAQAKLSQVTKGPTSEDLAAAQQNVVAAQAAYDDLLHPDANDVAALKANVDKAQAVLSQAQAAYDRVGGDSNPNAGALPQRAQLQTAWIDLQEAQALYNAKLHPSNAQLQQALAAVQTAKDQLAKLQPAAEERAALQADVKAAQAARDLAAAQLDSAKLVAPFAGTVMSLNIDAGEYVAPGAVVLQLADTSAWQIETTDLTELNIAQVSEGTPVTMTFDAIPDLQLTGKVTNIEPYGQSKQGDIVYTVFITPDKQDPRLRWNMTAKVGIQPNQ